jgi:TM2 domain-containing membrane protein YozV
MKKVLIAACLVSLIGTGAMPACAAGKVQGKVATTGKITPKTVAGGALSFLVWPGIGQAMNDEKGEKVLTHVVLGLTGVFRFWSCYDALVDRKGGYWEGRI